MRHLYMKPLAVQMECENWDGNGNAPGEWRGAYYLAAVAVEHPTEQLPGRKNLLLLNNPRYGMLQNEEKILAQATERRDAIVAAYDACQNLSNQELDWVVAHIKNNVR